METHLASFVKWLCDGNGGRLCVQDWNWIFLELYILTLYENPGRFETVNWELLDEIVTYLSYVFDLCGVEICHEANVLISKFSLHISRGIIFSSLHKLLSRKFVNCSTKEIIVFIGTQFIKFYYGRWCFFTEKLYW